MKKRLLAIEILLPSTPLLLLIIQQLFFRGSALDIHIHDTRVVVPWEQILLGIFVVHILYFFMHQKLRLINKRNVVACVFHIVTVLLSLLMIVIPVFVMQVQDKTAGGGPHETLVRTLMRGEIDKSFIRSILFFAAVHILFLFYFLILLIRNAIPSK